MSNQQVEKIENGEQKDVASVGRNWSPSLQLQNVNSEGRNRGLAMVDGEGKCEVNATNNCVTATTSGNSARAAAVRRCKESGGCVVM